MKRFVAVGGLLLAALLVVSWYAPGAGARAATPRALTTHPVDRVLVLSLPGVEWSDVQRTPMPNLTRLLRGSAVGALVTRGVHRPSPLGDSYVTIGAGTRSTADPLTVGQGFDADEPFGTDSAGHAFALRTGTRPGNGIVYLPIDDVIRVNDAELYDAKPGLLGDTLARAGIGRAVVANGDGTDPSTPRGVPTYRRAATAGLMTSRGRVPGGSVADTLLTEAPDAPYGVRLDVDAVVGAVNQAWHDRAVVLVEGSDLVRADLAGELASESARERLHARALRATDRLVGAVLHAVAGPRTAVLVVGPTPPPGSNALTVAGLRAPGVAPGLLRSATTQRDGFVSLVDVAPTILDLVGLDTPETMEGRAMERAGDSASLSDRVDRLAQDNARGLFRDARVGAAMTTVVVAGAIVALLACIGRRRTSAVAAFGALWIVGFLEATHLAGPLDFGSGDGNGVGYWLFVSGTALLLAGAFTLVGRRNVVDGLLAALGSLTALHLVDLLTGAHLEWSTVFGYSPTVGIRFVGVGNLAFAQLAASVTLFAGLLVWRRPQARTAAIVLLAGTVLVIGLPFWGNDFGGAMATAPAFALMSWLLLGRRLRWQGVLALAGTLVGAAVALGLLDLLRPPEHRTHVGRFFERIGTDFHGAVLIVHRKASENLSVIDSSVMLLMLVIVGLLLAWLWFGRDRPLRAVIEEIATARATMLGFAVVLVLGFALNDSGITIPGMMLAVLEVPVVCLVARRR